MNLSGNGLKDIPKELQLTNLEMFLMDRNGIVEIPDAIMGLKRLKALHLSKNNIRSLPAGLATLDELKLVDLSFNPLDNRDVKFLENALPDCKLVLHVKM